MSSRPWRACPPHQILPSGGISLLLQRKGHQSHGQPSTVACGPDPSRSPTCSPGNSPAQMGSRAGHSADGATAGALLWTGRQDGFAPGTGHGQAHLLGSRLILSWGNRRNSLAEAGKETEPFQPIVRWGHALRREWAGLPVSWGRAAHSGPGSHCPSPRAPLSGM